MIKVTGHSGEYFADVVIPYDPAYFGAEVPCGFGESEEEAIEDLIGHLIRTRNLINDMLDQYNTNK